MPIIVISLVKTKIFNDDVPYISLHKTLETKTNKQYLYDLSYVFIELGKFDKHQLASITDEWLHLFKCAAKENEPPENIKSKKVLDAYNVIEMHNLTPEEYDLYIRTKLMEDAEEIALSENFEKGKVEGIEIGETKRNIEIAKNLLLDGVNINTVTKDTVLTIEEIEKIKAEINNSEK
ncbi:MAG: PD-(D/E)XK nuclease family transposase [Rickettsia endosymbiont of Pentastiridius leporinus]